MRFSPHTPAERGEMLQRIGVPSIDGLFADIPPDVRLGRPLRLPDGISEMEVAKKVAALAARNRTTADLVSFLGAGAYDRFIPAAVDEILRRADFYTAYTPYQPEVSQGTLQVIWEFQSMMALLFEMDVAQASLYDGATAAAEGLMMAVGHTGRRRLVVLRSVDPETRGVVATYGFGHDLEIVEVPLSGSTTDIGAVREALSTETAALLVQQPNFLGSLEDLAALTEAAHSAGALIVVSHDPVAAAILKPPGAYGADIVVAEGQQLGIPLSFGGPYLGILTARQDLVRRMPGRIAGATVDGTGRRGYVLTLQTREQHIRRERATSNICTNQALLALAATVYLSVVGPGGLRQVEERSLAGAHALADALSALPGVSRITERPFCHEFAVRLSRPAKDVNRALLAHGILGGYPLVDAYPELGEGAWLVAVTEKRTDDEIATLVAKVGEAL